jgi:hypothetical protein
MRAKSERRSRGTDWAIYELSDMLLKYIDIGVIYS